MTIAFIPGTTIGGRVEEGMPCIVCHKKVEPGTGAPAMPPLPALHSKCIPEAMRQIETAKGRKP